MTSPADIRALREAELLPCPFCGGPAECRPYYEGSAVNGVTVGCNAKDCPANAWADGNTEAEAIAAWNRRATPVPAEGLVNALDDLQQAEHEYREMHDRHGDGSQAAGRAWDRLRSMGNEARRILNALSPSTLAQRGVGEGVSARNGVTEAEVEAGASLLAHVNLSFAVMRPDDNPLAPIRANDHARTVARRLLEAALAARPAGGEADHG